MTLDELQANYRRERQGLEEQSDDYDEHSRTENKW